MAFLGLYVPKEVRQTLAAFRKIVAENEYPFWASLAPKIEGEIRSEATVVSIKEQGFSPLGLSYYLISLQTFDLLASGSNHTYRGVLTMGGQMLLKMHRLALKGQIGQSPFTEKEIEEDMTRIDEAIQRAG